ncbi:MAG: hypothetical protein SFZ23_06065 [Planctomycetota bacterium]|nr:hypothetical protein [Planctomycetota bacterium]
MRTNHLGLVVACALLGAGTSAHGDNWQINITCDNQFDIYFGNSLATNFYAGGGNSWPTTYTYTALGRASTDYMYISTASDHSVAQGLIGDFTNLTNGRFLESGRNLGLARWEVFAAGAHAATNPYFPNPWPASLMPTQTQVDTAINHATLNNLWQPVDFQASYTNGALPWGFRPGISANALWIWHDSGNVPGGFYPAPYSGGNHNEFLVFRLAGEIPSVGTLPALALGGLIAGKRRRV